MTSGDFSLQHNDGALFYVRTCLRVGKAQKYFYSWSVFSPFLFGLVCAPVGLWMILPFAGIEVLVLSHVARKCYQREVPYLSQGKIRVEQEIFRPHLCWESELFWTRLIVSPIIPAWHGPRIILRDRDKEIEIGSLLTVQEK